MKKFSLSAYCYSHFAVDFCCFWILFGAFSNSAEESFLALGIITYNFIAFGLQMVFGAYCDSHRNFPAGGIGAALVLIAVISAEFAPFPAVLITALGNALFHTGGGIDSLVNSGGKLARGGIFVSAGALGVAFGTFAGKAGLSVFAVAAVAGLAAVLSFTAHYKAPVYGEANIIGAANAKIGIWTVLLLALFSVFIRSFGGGAMPANWKIGETAIFTAAFAAFGGKFLGGILADKFGAKSVGAASLVLSLPFIVFGRNIAFISVMGIALFNMTMPITLGICAEKLPKNPGLAFGLTTAALLLGAVPGFFFILSGNLFILIPSVLLSAIALWLCSENKKEVLP